MRYVNRTLSRGARAAAAAAAWRAIVQWDDADAAALSVILSGATEGTPPACQPTADGFRLHVSRVLRHLRFHPVRANLATPTPTPDASPYIGKPEPRVPRFLFQVRAARLKGRKLDPDGIEDTWTGQGFTPNGTDHAADAAVDAACRSAEDQWAHAAAAARLALERAGRTLPARVEPVPFVEPKEGERAWKPARAPRVPGMTSDASARLAQFESAATAWRAAALDESGSDEERAFARQRWADYSERAAAARDPWRACFDRRDAWHPAM